MFDSEAPTLSPEQPLTSAVGPATLSLLDSSAQSAERPRASSHLPASIGGYRIVALLGEGGMGAVYEAEQDQPRRRVALKVIRSGWASPELLRRFEQESQALGRLHHPGIAQIYEAGSADAGFGVQPFFAMELIHGQPLVEYAEAHKLNTRQRLALMVQVCDAVQHAHQRGIIHRDLKPGNILVDESGQPKVLDFGLARATDSDIEATRQTDVGQLLGTLAYMSPEQVTADPLAVDTRSDVYALGVILYELLAGKRPYALSQHLHEAVRTIQETDPAPLSSTDRLYRGDIDTIVSKALEKDKNRRYASAADLAADITRHLEDRPITAKPASGSYLLKKFARRHKAVVAGVSAVFVALVLGIVASTWEAVQARRAETTAKQQSEIAQAVNDFLQNDLLAQASAYNQAKADPDIKVRTALDRAAQKIQGKFANQPEVEASIRSTMGTTYIGMGLFPEAHRQLEAAVAIDRRTLGPDDPKTIAAMLSLTSAMEDEGKYPEAEALGNQVLEISKRLFGPEDPRTLKAMNRLSSILDYEGKYAQAEAIGTKAIEISRRVLGPEDLGTILSMHFLAIVYHDEGKYADAETLERQLIELRSRVLGPEHPDTLASMNNLAAAYAEEGKTAEAEALNLQTAALRSRVLGPEHPDTLETMGNLASDYRDEKKYAQAEALDRQIIEVQQRVLGPEHPETLETMHNLADDYRSEGKAAEAAALDLRLLAIRRRVLGPEDRDTLWSLNNVAVDYRAQGNYAQAEAADTQAFEGRARVFGAEHPYTLRSLNDLAIDYQMQGKYAQVEALYRKALAVSPGNQKLLYGYAGILLTAPDPAARRPKQALDLCRQALQGNPGDTNFLGTRGLAALRNGLWDEAVASMGKAVAADKQPDPERLFLLALAHAGRGDKAEAERFYKQGADAAKQCKFVNPQIKMFWAEAAKALHKRVPA